LSCCVLTGTPCSICFATPIVPMMSTIHQRGIIFLVMISTALRIVCSQEAPQSPTYTPVARQDGNRSTVLDHQHKKQVDKPQHSRGSPSHSVDEPSSGCRSGKGGGGRKQQKNGGRFLEGRDGADERTGPSRSGDSGGRTGKGRGGGKQDNAGGDSGGSTGKGSGGGKQQNTGSTRSGELDDDDDDDEDEECEPGTPKWLAPAMIGASVAVLCAVTACVCCCFFSRRSRKIQAGPVSVNTVVIGQAVVPNKDPAGPVSVTGVIMGQPIVEAKVAKETE